MLLYLMDLDDTLIDTKRHAVSVLYPAVAQSLQLPEPPSESILRSWGEPLDTCLPFLFGGTPYPLLLSQLIEEHRKSPPPAFGGIAARLHQLADSTDAHLTIFSAGHPEIVENSITRSLDLRIGETVDVYNLPPGRRLRPIDIDLFRDRCDPSQAESVVVLSDEPADYLATKGDRRAKFMGIAVPSVRSRHDHTAMGIPDDEIFSSAVQALDHIATMRRSRLRNDSVDLTSLESAVASRRLLVFLGAGVSVESGLPTAAGLASELGHSGEQLDRVMTAKLGSDPSLYAKLHRRFRAAHLRPNRIHRALALLDAPYYVGTNWDRLLEAAFKDLYGPQYDEYVAVAYNDGHLPRLVGRRNAYIKLHGDMDDRSSLVFDLATYGKRLTNPSLLDKLSEVLFNTSVVLFVGYSIRDINIATQMLEHVDWRGGSPPNRYAILPESSELDRHYLSQVNVQIINIEATDSGSIGDGVFDILAQLYDSREAFASDVALLSGVKRSSPTELYYEAYTYYQAGEFDRSVEAISAIRTAGLDWRQEPTLFARFCYLVVKVYDKQERWDELLSLDDLYISDHLRRAEVVLPGATFLWLRGHYASALALAALRAGNPVVAQKYADESIYAARRQPRAARLLLADRRVVRAMIAQYFAGCGDTDAAMAGWDDLLYARSALGQFGGLGTEDEVHLAGRFYGAAVFLHLTAALSEADSRGLTTESAIDHARKSHSTGSRVPYGILAGRYCEAHLWWKLSSSDGPLAASASEQLGPSLAALGEIEGAVQVGALAQDKLKLFRLRATGQPIPDHEFSSAYVPKHIERIGLDGWLGTPIN